MSPEESLITFPFRSRTGPDGLITGWMNLLPNSAWYPLYPPGSSGNRSATPPCALSQTGEPCAQCTDRPMKSASALFASLGFSASLASAELAPYTSGTSGSVFSSSVSAAATEPKSQPARL